MIPKSDDLSLRLYERKCNVFLILGILDHLDRTMWLKHDF